MIYDSRPVTLSTICYVYRNQDHSCNEWTSVRVLGLFYFEYSCTHLTLPQPLITYSKLPHRETVIRRFAHSCRADILYCNMSDFLLPDYLSDIVPYPVRPWVATNNNNSCALPVNRGSCIDFAHLQIRFSLLQYAALQRKPRGRFDLRMVHVVGPDLCFKGHRLSNAVFKACLDAQSSDNIHV
jgi:hypothetical protein